MQVKLTEVSILERINGYFRGAGLRLGLLRHRDLRLRGAAR
jgi:hypothetical protein